MNNSVAELLLIIIGVALLLGFQGTVGLLFFGFFVLLAGLLFWISKKETKNKTAKKAIAPEKPEKRPIKH